MLDGTCGARVAVGLWGAALAAAALVGTNKPAAPVTEERVRQTLPAAQQGRWLEYLKRSVGQGEADQAFVRREVEETGAKEATVPPGGRGIPRNRPAEWYATAEAAHMADIVISFQTPAGGWSKNANWNDHVRQKGEGFAPNNLSRFLAAGDFDTPHDSKWNYVGTLDNDATNTELRFLAKVAAASADSAAAGRWRAAFLRGLDYLLAAQYPNGGWPQVYPLEGGYHDAITVNDGAMTETLETLQLTAGGKGEYAFVPSTKRRAAADAVDRGVECLLDAQIRVHGVATAWAQQHDALTLEPVSARNYEPPALCSSESAGVLLFLMDLAEPKPAVEGSIRAAVAWLNGVAIHGKAYRRGPDGGALVDAAGAPSLWARFYSIETGAPIFGDRDKSIHDDVSEISRERRNGYSWYNSAAQAALDRYVEWAKAHPAAK